MILRTVVRATLAVVVVLVAACGVRGDPIDDMETAGPPETIVIHVENRATQQATIYVIQDRGMRMRLGVVPAHGQEFFEQEVWLGRTVEFDVRLLAGGTYRTSSVPASPGDTVHVTIPPHL